MPPLRQYAWDFAAVVVPLGFVFTVVFLGWLSILGVIGP